MSNDMHCIYIRMTFAKLCATTNEHNDNYSYKYQILS